MNALDVLAELTELTATTALTALPMPTVLTTLTVLTSLTVPTALTMLTMLTMLYYSGWYLLDLKEMSDAVKYLGKLITQPTRQFILSNDYREDQVQSSSSSGSH